jgi:hypothetical protein
LTIETIQVSSLVVGREKAGQPVIQIHDLTFIESSYNMNPLTRNILAVVAGFVIGSVVNMGLINIGMQVVPLPEGSDTSTMEGLAEAMEKFTPANFVFPLLAHALGTLVGAIVAAKLAVSHQMKFALGIGVSFLLGGITMIYICGGPAWFIATDLLLAYIPMGYLGGVIAGGRTLPVE